MKTKRYDEMNKFKIGDNVKLINNEFNYGLVLIDLHFLDEVFTVLEVISYGDDDDIIRIKSLDGKMNELLSKRFELVEEEPLDDRFEKWND